MMTIMTTTMTTMTTNDREELFRKAVRVRGLTDPLGAMGFRTQSQRARKEKRIRRFLFTLTALGFAGIFGTVVATAPAQTWSGANGVTDASNPTAQSVRVNGATSQQEQERPAHSRTRGS